MTDFDASQRRVLGLDPGRHARILGAPGSGKTTLLVESYARFAAEPSWSEADVLVLAANRMIAARLRGLIEERWKAPLGGSPARTATSFAFGLLRHQAALTGGPLPRLLTGTVHDDTVAAVVSDQLENGGAAGLPFAPEVLESAAFRAELRELSGVLDDFAVGRDELRARLGEVSRTDSRESDAPGPAAELVELWGAALTLLSDVDERLAAEHAGEYSASALLRAATEIVLHDESVRVPRLVLIDDAQELGEGHVGLLAALAVRGARIWAFGDPDIATGAFRGERSRLLAGIESELRRRARGAGVVASSASLRDQDAEQIVILESVHRHGAEIRDFTRRITERIGAFGVGQQRAAGSAVDEPAEAVPGAAQSAVVPSPAVQFETVASVAEQLGAIGHRLRRRYLGLDGRRPVGWGEMAVICRSRGEATRAARMLAGHQVPTSIAAGGVVLRDQSLVRELIRLLQHALGIDPLRESEIGGLLRGDVGGLDPVALRRFRAALRAQEDRDAREEGRAPESVDVLIWDGFIRPGDIPVTDSRGGRRLRRLGRLARAAVAVHERGGTPRETLWAIWEGTGLAEGLQRAALEGRGTRADEAHRVLDAVMGVFFALQRHEEQASTRPVADLLEELLTSIVPEDTLASRSERESVTVTTPQSVIGREFSVICVLGLQDGAWPNLRSRGLLLGASPLERWLRGDDAVTSSRRDTLHDELRLLAQTVSRARDEVLAVAVLDEDHHPSSFYGLGRAHESGVQLPSTRLTLRGAVAEMRRRLARDPSDQVALTSLVALADAGAAGAHPDEWYGARPPTTTDPLVDLALPGQTVRVSPSGIEKAETCPLDWAIGALGGSGANLSADLGTLLHSALESVAAERDDVSSLEADDFMSVVDANWSSLTFDAAWQEDQQHVIATRMAESLVHYLRDFASSGRRLIGTEVGFSVRVGPAELSGKADRLEARTDAEGRVHVTVVDLKTGKKAPSKADRETHAQLQAYQLGVIEGAFAEDGSPGDQESDGARLLYVHPNALGKTGPGYLEADQAPLTPEAVESFRARIAAVAEIMSAGSFTANVEHHCDDDHAVGRACRLHIIPPVSHA